MSFITDFPAILDLYRAQRGVYTHQYTVEDEVYLTKYKYLDKKKVDATMRVSSLMDTESLTDAIKKFQRFAGLRQTGKPDRKTLQKMREPRCGMADDIHDVSHARRTKRSTLLGSQWGKNDLTYRIRTYSRQLSEWDTDYWIRQAFKVWMAVTPLRFYQVTDRTPDIEIIFKGYSHGDPYKFDGRGSTLAHAFQPGRGFGGDTHFDDSEKWTLRTPNSGTDLFTVAVHEFGHSLGLGHSKVPGSIMQPFYRYTRSESPLKNDDITAIQGLYGSNRGRKPYPREPTTTRRPKPTTTTVAPTKIPMRPVPDFCKDVMQFDAIVSTAAGKTYAFVGWEDVYIWDGINLEPTTPKRISDVFEELHWGLHTAFSVKWGDQELIYVTYRWFVWIYDAKDLRLIKAQIAMYKIFPDLPDDLDAAFKWEYDGNIYIFKGEQYWKVHQHAQDQFKAAPGYPRDTAEWNLPSKLRSQMSAAFSWPVNGRTYFFSGLEYYIYDDAARKVSGFPRSMMVWFLHCPDPDNGFNMYKVDAQEGVNSAVSMPTMQSALFMFTIATIVMNLA